MIIIALAFSFTIEITGLSTTEIYGNCTNISVGFYKVWQHCQKNLTSVKMCHLVFCEKCYCALHGLTGKQMKSMKPQP